jgi:hypothetical protein
VVAAFNGNYFVLESGGTTQGYSEEVLQLLAARARRWDVTQVVVEANFGDGMFQQLLQPVMNRVHPCGIEEVRVNIQKERRIVDTLAPVVQQHRLVMSSEMIRRDYREAERDPEKGHIRSLMYQLSRITIERGALVHDDRIDALALGVQFFVELAAQDQHRMAKQRKSELLDWELECFMDTTGESIDALVMGVRTQFSRKAYGGIRRQEVNPRQ